MEPYKRNIALEWYQYGLEKGDDFFMRFMMHWVAFNWLYNSEGEDLEWDNIYKYFRRNKARLEKYDAFSSPAIEIFMEGPVYGKNMAASKENYEGVKQNNTYSLIKTLYCVRCNLFHGSKSLMIERDQDLVRASAVILEGYLKALLT